MVFLRSSRGLARAGLIVWASLWPSLAAQANPANRSVQQGRQLIQKALRYQEGIALLERALRSEALTDEERAEAYGLLGVAFVAKGAPKSAEAAFDELLKLDPGHRLDPLLSPKIQEIFERALKKRTPKILDVQAEVQKRSIAFSARLEDPATRIAKVELRAKDGAGNYQATEMAREQERLQAVLLIPSVGAGRVEYHLVGLDAQRRPLASAGSAQAPLSVVYQRALTERVSVDKAPSPQWYERWWIWAIAGAVVAGSVTTAVVLSRDGGDPPSGTLEPIQLDLRASHR